jgi:hypothetical protein
LKAGEVRAAVDIQVRATPAFKVSGTLESADGPIGTTSVELLPLVSATAGESPFPTATAAVDPAGRFTLLGVPPGQYVLRAIKVPRPKARQAQSTVVQTPGGSTISRGTVTDAPSIPRQPTMSAVETITVGQRDLNGLRIVMQHGFRVSGRIVFEGASERPPLARLSPYMDPIGPWRGVYLEELVVNAQGEFDSFEMPPGSYRLTLPLPSGWIVKSAIAGDRDLAELPFDLTDHVSDIVLTVTDRIARVTGAVRRADGTADPAASVFIFPVDPRQWVDISAYARRFRDVRSGRDGSYTLADLIGGDYFVIALSETPIEWSPVFMDRVSRLAARVTLGDGEQRALDLRSVVLR